MSKYFDKIYNSIIFFIIKKIIMENKDDTNNEKENEEGDNGENGIITNIKVLENQTNEDGSNAGIERKMEMEIKEDENSCPSCKSKKNKK